MQRLHKEIYPGAKLTLLQVGQFAVEDFFIADVMVLNISALKRGGCPGCDRRSMLSYNRKWPLGKQT
jgi:hypothetical protein